MKTHKTTDVYIFLFAFNIGSQSFGFFCFFPPPSVCCGKNPVLSAGELTCQKACCSYDLSHVSCLCGDRVVLFPWLSYSKNMINVVSSGWLRAGSPRKKLKGRRPLWPLLKQGLFNYCSRGICSQDLIKSPLGLASHSHLQSFHPI